MPCFNGAVTFSLRKLLVIHHQPLLYLVGLQWGRNFFVTEIRYTRMTYLQTERFNGAVTFSLRKSLFALASKKETSSLQWGRNFFVTEMIIDFPNLIFVSELQWGRNFFVTEIRHASIRHIADNVLQWGRNFFVTEIPTPI